MARKLVRKFERRAVLSRRARTRVELPADWTGGRSISVLVGGRREHGPHQDPKIEPERPVVDVVQVVFDPAAHLVIGVGFTAEAVDLRPSGDARPDVVAPGVDQDPSFVGALVREGVRTGADERHVALDHVEQLWKLIDVPATQPGTDLGDARIVLLRLADDRPVLERPHGPELDDPERFLIETETMLQEENRSLALALYIYPCYH